MMRDSSLCGFAFEFLVAASFVGLVNAAMRVDTINISINVFLMHYPCFSKSPKTRGTMS